MSMSQDPEIKCTKCSGRMYYDDFMSKIREKKPIWVCMDCNYKRKVD